MVECMERLEKEVNSLSTKMLEGQERMMKHMEEMLAASSLQVEQLVAGSGGSREGNCKEMSSYNRYGRQWFQIESNSSLVPKLAKLDFSKYDGSDDPTSWVCRTEQFFEFQNIIEEEQLPLAAYHLEGKAQLWYQLVRDREE